MLRCGLKLAARSVDSGASWEAHWYRRKSVTAYAQLGATWYELQSEMYTVATFGGLGGTEEKQGCKPRLAATSAGFGAT